MSLEKWAEFGWVKTEPTSKEEIAGLLQIVDRDLKDAGVSLISNDRRFEAAFNAARMAATTALRASGFRSSQRLSHHLETLDSLEMTIGADTALIQSLREFSKKRNATSYDMACNVTGEELEQMIAVATQLQQRVFVWLQTRHPELVGDVL
jgi:hypothetical protein